MPDQQHSPAPPSTPSRTHFLGHISLGIRNYEISKTFYTAIFAPFNITLVYSNSTSTPRILGFGPSSSPSNELVTLFEKGDDARAPGPGMHIAFNAPSRRCVREFWEAGVRSGGRDDGPPGVRVEIGERYYAAFVVDPDGYRLEGVYQGEDDDVVEK